MRRNLNGAVIWWFGMTPALVVRGYIWQSVSYMFLHAGFVHLIFNMLAVDVRGRPRTPVGQDGVSSRYYFVCGVGQP